MRKVVFFLSLFFMVLVSCKSQTNKGNNITVKDLKTVLETESKVQLLDVRTPEEWTQGVIKTPIKIDIKGSDFEERALEKLDKTQPVYIYCRSGGRSKKAAELLSNKGFKVYNILGGYLEWTAQNK